MTGGRQKQPARYFAKISVILDNSLQKYHPVFKLSIQPDEYCKKLAQFFRLTSPPERSVYLYFFVFVFPFSQFFGDDFRQLDDSLGPTDRFDDFDPDPS